MTWVALFAALLVAHLVGDYLLQTEWQAVNKNGGLGADATARRALGSHVATYTLAFVPVLLWVADTVGAGVAAGALVAIAIPHAIVDDGRVVNAYMVHVKHADGANAGLVTAVDQSFHVVALWLVALGAAAA